MTHSDFNHLLTSVDSLSPEQMRQQLDEQLAQRKKPAAQPSGKGAARAKAAPQQAKKPLTADEFNQQLFAAAKTRTATLDRQRKTERTHHAHIPNPFVANGLRFESNIRLGGSSYHQAESSSSAPTAQRDFYAVPAPVVN